MKLTQRLALRYIRTKFKVLSAISKKKAAAAAFTLFCTPRSRNKKKIPRIFEQAEKLHFSMEGISIKGWRWDHPGGKKVLILHGYESSVVNFDRYVRPLIKKGYEVLAFDAPAHGRSGGKKITAPLYKQMIKEINDRFGPVHSYMAHSFGGLAVSLALEETEHTDMHRLVLIAPATETTTAIDSFFKFLQLDPSLREEFEKIIVKQSGVTSEWYSIRRAMKHIRAKLLWVHDEGDDVTPLTDAMKVRSDGHSNIEFMITTGLGHSRIYRDNKVTKAVVDFL